MTSSVVVDMSGSYESAVRRNFPPSSAVVRLTGNVGNRRQARCSILLTPSPGTIGVGGRPEHDVSATNGETPRRGDVGLRGSSVMPARGGRHAEQGRLYREQRTRRLVPTQRL
jgi:hypothetical protein